MKEYFDKFMKAIYEVYNLNSTEKKEELDFLFEGRMVKKDFYESWSMARDVFTPYKDSYTEKQQIATDDFIKYCRKNQKAISELFLQTKTIDEKQMYELIKYIYGHIFNFIDPETVFLSRQFYCEMVKQKDVEFVNKLLENITVGGMKNTMAKMFMESSFAPLFFEMRKTSGYLEYYYQEGYTQREIVGLMKLPEGFRMYNGHGGTAQGDLNYDKLVLEDDRIEVYNTIFFDACRNEKWPIKIPNIIKDKINQDNLISILISHFNGGLCIGDETLGDSMKEYYEMLVKLIHEDKLNLYDYKNQTYDNIVQKYKEQIDFNRKAPVTSFILEKFKTELKEDQDLDDYLNSITELSQYVIAEQEIIQGGRQKKTTSVSKN